MIKKLTIYILVLIFSVLVVFTPAWGRSIIQGQVLDSHTGEPIKDAAVQIYWGETKGIIGMTYGVKIDVVEDLTDAQGYFKIPKYFWFKGYHYYMHIYKKGYVCWKNTQIFPTYEQRKGFRLQNGMEIKLERFKEEYSKEKHARFAKSIYSESKSIYDEATKAEQELLYNLAQKQRAEYEAQRAKDKKEVKAFIDCMHRAEKGKYNIQEFCGGNWSSRLRKKIRDSYKIPPSDISKAMVEFSVIFEYDKENESSDIYILKD